MSKILIVEDDNEIAILERDYLEINDYETVWIEDGNKVEEMVFSDNFDLIILDVMLPGKNGYEICRELRNKIDIPILMVTAKTESIDIIRGLGLGADDYIAKPFDPAELVARVKSHLNRYKRLKGDVENIPNTEIVEIDDLKIHLKSYKAYRNSTEIKFTNREFELLRFLIENANIVYSKEELFEKIWGYEYIGDSATVAVHINRIREKIEMDPNNPKIIETVWGAGYRLNRK